LLLLRLSSFGIWDPWEVEVAEPARRLAEGGTLSVPNIGTWLVGQSYRLLGVHEWSGRLPIAIFGLLMLACTYPLIARFADRRAALYAVLIAGTSPLFLFNARTMLGEAPAFAIQTAIAWTASAAVFGVKRGGRARFAWLAAAIAFTALGIAGRGALLCAMPPLAAVTIAAVLEGRLLQANDDSTGRLCAWALSLLTAIVLIAIARDINADASSYSIWLGGAAEGGQPPSFDAVLERTFHAFAPWSALLPLGLARLALGSNADDPAQADDERRMRLFLLIWIALGYGALSLYLSRYGHKAALVPVAALAGAVAMLLRDIERSGTSQWPAAIASVLLALLVVRDYGLYPNSAVHGMPVADFAVPEVFNPIVPWAIVLGLFTATIALGFGASGEEPNALDLRQPYRWLDGQWRRGLGDKLWLAGFALLLLGLLVFGLSCWLPFSAKHLTTIAVKVGKILMLLPPAIPLAVAGVQLILHFARRQLREQRSLPMLVAGLGVGGYAAFGFMPALSSHFSPREVYETYNELAKRGEPLVEYKVGARAAKYYARGAALEVDNVNQLIEQLAAQQRHWATFPSDELPAIDRLFRTRMHRHLFVADARNARVLLATNQAIEGRANKSFVAQSVMDEPPKIQHPVSANFEDKLQFLGYDLKLPHGDHVGATEHFSVVWYFKALKPVGNFRVFVHIDAESMRIHGDHDPVDGKYPVRLWDPGDVIADTQDLEVPANYPAGDYTIYLGFYSGDTRLTVKEGPKDDANRVVAGVLRIR
jgi:4-amino-4-deoxy-L-arabinose transferase-like glycosyltransferase